MACRLLLLSCATASAFTPGRVALKMPMKLVEDRHVCFGKYESRLHVLWRPRVPDGLKASSSPQAPPEGEGASKGRTGDRTGDQTQAEWDSAERIRLLEAQAERAEGGRRVAEEERAAVLVEMRKREEVAAAERDAAERAAAKKAEAERVTAEQVATERAAAGRAAAEQARQDAVQLEMEREKIKKLFFSISIDLIGMATYAVPIVGEAGDIGWAPISALLIYKLYGNGFISGLAFAEELLPGLDFIPTATIAWFLENTQFGQGFAQKAPPSNSAKQPPSEDRETRRQGSGMKSAQVVDEKDRER